MKKIIGLIGILLLTANSFGQISGQQLCWFREKATVLRVVNQLEQWGYANQYLDIYAYSFVIDNKIYVLSYDTTSPTYVKKNGYSILERNVYLFCIENNTWKPASDVVKTDFYRVDSQGIASYEYYYPTRVNFSEVVRNVKDGVSNGYVMKLDDGSVQILLVSFTCSNQNQNYSNYDYRWDIFTLTPNGNGFYTVRND